MILYTVISKNNGWNYSSLIVTYPISVSPNNVISLGIKSAELVRSRKLQSYNIKSGEIPTTLPFKVAKVAQINKYGSVINLANDEFMECNSEDVLFETKSITLAVQENQHIKLVDGLAYVLNELDKFHVSPKKFNVVPFIYSDSITTFKFLENLREDTYFNPANLCEINTEFRELNHHHQLAFINLANQYFNNKSNSSIVIEKSNRYDPRNKIISKLSSNKKIDLCINLKTSVDILKTEPPQKPVLADNFQANELLLRSIIVSNWINNPLNPEEIARGSKLALRYKIPLLSWKEILKVQVWTNQWDQIAWTGKRSISYLRKNIYELPNLKSIITLINRRGFILLFFPIFSIITADSWMKLSLDLIDFFPFAALSIFLAVLGPLFAINAFYKIAKKEKLTTHIKIFSAMSFLLVGFIANQYNIQFKDAYYFWGLLPVLLGWLLWQSAPLHPKIGKALFHTILIGIPLSSFSLGSHNWSLFFSGIQIYQDVDLIINHIIDAITTILNLFF